MRQLPTTSNDDRDVSGSFGKIEKVLEWKVGKRRGFVFDALHLHILVNSMV